MNQFDRLAEASNVEFLKAFGEKALINGLSVQVIFVDDEIDLETGYKREPYITVERKAIKTMKRGDSVFVRSTAYKINNIPDITSETMIELELKRA